jgi:hypothetical protein
LALHGLVLVRARRAKRSSILCQNRVTYLPETLGQPGDLRAHVDAHPERFADLRDELGPHGFEAIEIDSRPGNPYGICAGAHSVVTRELVDCEGQPTNAALERVLGFFRERLQPLSRTLEPTSRT